MTKVDQFESVFKASAKEVYTPEDLSFRKVLVVTDLTREEAGRYGERVRAFLSVLGEGIAWRDLGSEEVGPPEKLLGLVEAERPDLVCTYRNLHSSSWKWPYSLGEHLDVLTQVAPMPVLVTPHPSAGRESGHALRNTDRVMVITDHLAGDDDLVSHGVRFTQPEGTLFLTHVEDERGFERFMEVISKVPEIDTQLAREHILERLLKDPGDYILSCRGVLEQQGRALRVESLVLMGRHLATYQKLIDEHEVDLLVLNTKDEDQPAMNGLAWPLAIALRHIPLLLL